LTQSYSLEGQLHIISYSMMVFCFMYRYINIY